MFPLCSGAMECLAYDVVLGLTREYKDYAMSLRQVRTYCAAIRAKSAPDVAVHTTGIERRLDDIGDRHPGEDERIRLASEVLFNAIAYGRCRAKYARLEETTTEQVSEYSRAPQT